jgi:ketosteroid isomerase-like protein
MTDPTTQPPPGFLPEPDRAELMTALRDSAHAWNRGDLAGHLALYDPGVVVMTPTGPRPGVAALARALGEAYFANGHAKQSLGLDDVTIRPLSEGSALMTGRFTLHGGGEPDRSGWFTLVWVRTAAGWRAVHDHSS